MTTAFSAEGAFAMRSSPAACHAFYPFSYPQVIKLLPSLFHQRKMIINFITSPFHCYMALPVVQITNPSCSLGRSRSWDLQCPHCTPAALCGKGTARRERRAW